MEECGNLRSMALVGQEIYKELKIENGATTEAHLSLGSCGSRKERGPQDSLSPRDISGLCSAFLVPPITNLYSPFVIEPSTHSKGASIH